MMLGLDILKDRTPPISATIRSSGQDWLGRGPKVRKGHVFYHGGVDLFNKKAGVVSPASGRVIYAVTEIPKTPSLFGGYGPAVVVVEDTDGLFHWLAHVKNPTVKRNQFVHAGQQVAEKVGSDHVHWEIREKLKPYDEKGDYWPWTVSIDPLTWLEGYGAKAKEAVKLLESGVPVRDQYPIELKAKMPEKSKPDSSVNLPDTEIKATWFDVWGKYLLIAGAVYWFVVRKK